MSPRTLVVGASGILAPLASCLQADGDEVTGVSRARAVPPGVDAVLVDARSATALAGALGERTWDRAVIYAPAVSADSLGILARRVAGRVVLVRTSASADPERGTLSVPDDTVQLGWTHDAHGRPRWHTPAEVSAIASMVLADGAGRILGRVRPWEERP